MTPEAITRDTMAGDAMACGFVPSLQPTCRGWRLLGATLLAGLLAGVFAAAPSKPALAQLLPTPNEGDLVNPRSLTEFEREQQRRAVEQGAQMGDRRPVRPEDEALQTAPEGADKITFKLKEINFSKSAVFSQEELDGFVAPYIGRTISVADLFAITAMVNKEYRDRGYLTTQAVLVPQQISGGKVKIKLIEGTIGNIDVTGNRHVKSSFVISRVRIVPGTIPTIELLERRISAVNWNRNFQVTAGLKPGEKPATTDLELDVSGEPNLVSGSIYVDNHGTKESGLYDLGIIMSLYSPFGFDEFISVGFTNSVTDFDRVLTNYDVNSYFFDGQFPLPVGNGSLRAIYSHSNSAVLQGEFETLGVDGVGDFASVSVYQPLISTPMVNFSILGGGQLSDTTSSVGIVDTDTVSYRAFGGLKAQVSRPEKRRYFEAEFRVMQSWVEIKGLAGQINEDVTRLVGEAMFFQDLDHGFSFQSRLAGQFTPERRLPSTELWYMGGVSSLPAYGLSTISGDKGFFLDNEVRYEPARLMSSAEQFLRVPVSIGLKTFVDIGAAYDDFDFILDRAFYSDVGIGADFQIAERVAGDFLVAWPIDNKVDPGVEVENPRFLFSVSTLF